MIRLCIQFAAPLLSVILMIFGSAFFTTFVSVFLDLSGYQDYKIGIIQSAYFAGMFTGAFQMERVIRRVGHVQALVVFGSIAITATLGQSLLLFFSAWVLLRFLVGLSLSAIYIVIESWMLHHSTLYNRGAILSLYMICLLLSQAVSQQVLAAIDINTYVPYILSSMFLALGLIPVGLSTKRIMLPETTDEISFSKLFNRSPFGVVGCFISGLMISTIFSFFPLFSLSRGIPSENLMSITLGGGVVLQGPIGKLSDYFDRRATQLVIVLLTLLLSIFGFSFSHVSNEIVMAICFFIGGLAFALYPVSVSQVCDRIDHSQITAATALLLIVYGFGSVLGPVTSSTLISAGGIEMIFGYFTVLLGTLASVGFYVIFKRPMVPLEEQTDFQPLPNVTPVAYEMDPRSDVDSGVAR